MFIRRIGKILRGKATPFQIYSATVICGLLGSLPGILQGPLLLLILLFLLIVLNANLFLGGLTLLAAKLISLLLLSVHFSVGTYLIEGPLNGLVSSLVNMPVLAWFGLEYYVMIPSLLTGLVFGLIVGFAATRGLSSFRKKMASLESGSEKYQAYVSKWWVRLLAWIFVGGVKGKKSWNELSESRRGLPVRPLGIVFVVSLGVLIWVAVQFLDTRIVTSLVRDELEQVNGATVDLQSVEILAADNRIILNQLDMADPEMLNTNRFSSKQITADLSGYNLLAKKIVIDELNIAEPKSGLPRKIPGKITVEPVDSGSRKPDDEDVVSIDDYLGAASVWKERLETAKRIYDKVAPYIKKKSPEESGETGDLSWREQLALRAKELGYAKVKAASLVSKSPRIWIKKLNSDNLQLSGSDDRFAIQGENLSSQPNLLDESGKIQVSRLDGELEFEISLPNTANPATSAFRIRYDGIEVDEFAESVGKSLPISGGKMDLSGTGTINSGILDLPLTVVLNNSTLSAFGQTLPVDGFPMKLTVSGPIDDPSLKIPKEAIQEALMAGGKKQIENIIKQEAGDQLKKLFNLGG